MVNYIDWSKEPDLEELRRLVGLLPTMPLDALPALQSLAEKGSVASCTYLAHFFLEGAPPSMLDISKAMHWYAVAQDRGNPEAAYMLGRLHYRSNNFHSALVSFAKGTEYGYAPAIYRLAGLYERGEGTSRDVVEYRRLLELAYSKRHIPAKRDLAWLLLSGRFGVGQAVRGLLIYLSLATDIGYLVGKMLTPGSRPDERVLT